jgi:hypothetical protein
VAEEFALWMALPILVLRFVIFHKDASAEALKGI